MNRRRLALAGLLLCALGVTLNAAPAPQEKAALDVSRLQSLDSGLRVSAHRVLDVNGDGTDDLLLIGHAGEVRTHLGRADGSGFQEKAVGALVLPSPARSALSVADVLSTGRPQLAVLSPAGLTVHEVGVHGGFRRAAVAVLPRARFRLRLGSPTFAEFLRDVNGDGRPDLILPRGEECELWLNDGVSRSADDKAGGADAPSGPATPSFRQTARARIKIRRSHEATAGALSDVLESSLRIPQLQFEDVNGDGRDDLIVASSDGRAFHMQTADGSIPTEPTVQVDLRVFRDTTPDARIKLGSTLAGEKDARLEVQDLDQDGIPDYVIAHRRKVWIFHGTKQGPQFTEPTAVLKTAEDVTALLVVPLDEDAFPDLLLLRVEVPELGSILKGLFTEWDLDVTAVAYASKDGRTFDKKPRWRNDIAIRLPAILGVLRDPERLMRKFEALGRTFRESVEADLTGDGVLDVALLAEDEPRLDIWDGSRTASGGQGRVVDFKDLIFGKRSQDWSLDSLVQWLSDVGRRQSTARTGGRPPDGGLDFRDEKAFDRVDVLPASLGSRSVLLVSYDRIGGKAGRQFDVYQVK